MDGVLVVIPCGRKKVWDSGQHVGPAAARSAYASPRFRAHRAYAERFGQQWVILSAKYGFIDPDFSIPGPYDVTFNDPSTGPISLSVLREQVVERGLGRFRMVVGLGGPAYCAAIGAAFEGPDVEVRFPFAGLPIGLEMQRVQAAIAAGQPFDEHGATSLAGRTRNITTVPVTGPERARRVPGQLTRDVFLHELERMLREARRQGQEWLDVRAGDLHSRVGSYPGKDHRMPVCCAAMRDRMCPGDSIVQAPPRGRGANLIIRYTLRTGS